MALYPGPLRANKMGREAPPRGTSRILRDSEPDEDLYSMRSIGTDNKGENQ